MDYFESEEFSRLLKSYEEAKEHNLPCYLDGDDFIDIAEYYVRGQKFEKAMQATDDGLALHPDDMGLMGMKVSALINLNRIDEARETLSMLDSNENFDYYYLQAQILLADEGDILEANDLFKKWLDCEIDDMKAELHGQIDQQRLHEDYMHVMASFSELNQEDDNIPTFIEGWADDFMTKCEELGEYQCDFEIARVCHEEGLIDKEIVLYTAFLDNDPYIDGAWTYLASIQHMNGQMEEAVNSAGFALAINPDDSYTVMLRAHSYFVMDKYAEALKDYVKYEMLTGENCNAHIIGKCLMMLGRRKEGYDYLCKAGAYTASRGDEPDSIANTWAFISQAYIDGEFLAEAMETVEKALCLEPDTTEYILLKANVFLKQHDWDEARYWFMKSLETTNQKVMVELCIGGDYVYENRFDDAMDFFRMATEEQDPLSIRAFAYISFLFYRMGDRENFRRSLKIACENTPDTIRAFWEDELKDIPVTGYYDRLKDLIP